MADIRDNSKQVEIRGASSATVSSVSGSASSAQLVAANATRRGLTLFNDSSATAYVKFGTTASTSSYTVRMRPNDFYEMPIPLYTGRVDCIWASATGAMRITEY